jgi:endonuclease YncB( thermonuclease family)
MSKSILLYAFFLASFTLFSAEPYETTVEHVVDGDTVKLKNEKTGYRLYGIDAPELKQPGGPQARIWLKNMLEGKTVKVEEIKGDRYGRKVIKIWLDGKYINLEIVKAGWAWWYNFFAPDDSDIALAELDARRKKRGLWAEPDPPAEFRKANKPTEP